LLRSQDNNCLPSEVEKELKKHHRRQDLILFYEKQNRHRDALQLIKSTDSLNSNDTILNYLSKLDNNDLQLVFEYVQPILKTALEEKNNEDLNDILILFVGEPTPTSPSTLDAPNSRTIKLDPIEVYGFLKDINQDFAIRYMENICFKAELGPKQRDIHNRIVYAYCDRLKHLSNELKRLIKENKNNQQDIYEGIYFKVENY
jgi:hypothetical protein